MPHLVPNSNKLGKCEHLTGYVMILTVMIVKVLDAIMMLRLCFLKFLYLRETHQIFSEERT